MRYPFSLRSLVISALIAVTVAACGSERSVRDGFALVGDDGTWSGTVSSDGIVFRRQAGRGQDSLVFASAEPRDDGVVRRYTVVRMAADTHRIDIGLSTAPCIDERGGTYPHRAKVWIDQMLYVGCAIRR